MFQNNMYQQPTSDLTNVISGTINGHVTNMVRAGQITQFDGQNLISQAQQYMNNIIGYLNDQATRRGDNAVHTSEVESAVADVIKQLIQSCMQSNQQMMPVQINSSFMQPTNPYQALQTGAIGMTNERPIQINQIHNIQKPQAAKEVKPEVVVNRALFLKSNSPVYNYTQVVDNDIAKYSMSSTLSGPLLSVSAKIKIVSESGESYNYCDVTTHIAEPSLIQAIDNFVNTNPILCSGSYIANLRYILFDLRKIKESQCKAIDLSPFHNSDTNKLPVDVTIQKVLDSITDRGYDIATVLSELIVDKFNDYMDRYCRLSTNVSARIHITDLKDLSNLASMRNRDFGELTFHKDYEDVILSCFTSTIAEIIMEETKNGFYDALDIASDLLTDPSFVIRKQGMCERELDLSNEEFVKEIRNQYTAYANSGSVILTNFIPDELEEDLSIGPIQVDGYTNPLDYVTTSILRREKNTIIMREGERLLIVKCGRTMDGVNFIYKSSVEFK